MIRRPPSLGGCDHPDLGDLVIVLLAGMLVGLRDQLMADGFEDAADLVADLAEIADDHIGRRSWLT